VLSDNKVIQWVNPVVNQPDRPNISAQELKSTFDANSNQLKDAFNGLIDDLQAESGSSLIGTTAVVGVEGTTIGQQIASLKGISDATKTIADDAKTSAAQSATAAQGSRTAAESAQGSAEQSAASAATSLSQVNTAVQQTNTVIGTANTAITNANNAATVANTKGTYAQTQGDYAKAQGNYAKEKGDAATLLNAQFQAILDGAVNTVCINWGI